MQCTCVIIYVAGRRTDGPVLMGCGVVGNNIIYSIGHIRMSIYDMYRKRTVGRR